MKNILKIFAFFSVLFSWSYGDNCQIINLKGAVVAALACLSFTETSCARSCQTTNKFLVREPYHYDEMRQRFLSLRDVQNARRGNLLLHGSCSNSLSLRWNVVTEAISSQATLVFLITSLRS
jgi:hypothetical protein